jgi:hypothetical protein
VGKRQPFFTSRFQIFIPIFTLSLQHLAAEYFIVNLKHGGLGGDLPRGYGAQNNGQRRNNAARTAGCAGKTRGKVIFEGVAKCPKL